MIKFIKLHGKSDGFHHLVNVAHIESLCAAPDGGSHIIAGGGNHYYRETPEQIEQMIGRLVDHERAPDTV
jgi:uncharacterized protein YlzI (FlbEa/FlbD family)